MARVGMTEEEFKQARLYYSFFNLSKNLTWYVRDVQEIFRNLQPCARLLAFVARQDSNHILAMYTPHFGCATTGLKRWPLAMLMVCPKNESRVPS